MTDAAALQLASTSFDLVLGADVLYSKGRDFDKLFATVRLLLQRGGHGAAFVTAYQHRSSHRSLEALLHLWWGRPRIASHVIQRIMNPGFWSCTPSHDVASIARHITQFI